MELKGGGRVQSDLTRTGSNRTLVELKVGPVSINLRTGMFQSYLSGIESWSGKYKPSYRNEIGRAHV